MNFTFSHPNIGSYDFSLIAEDSILDSFQTGPDGDVLGSWLREKARVCHQEDLTRVWLRCPAGKTEPDGYFSLANHELMRSNVGLKPKKLAYEADDEHRTVVGVYENHPAQLLGKFALDMTKSGQPGMSSMLLAGVFRAYLEAAKYSASRYLVLHVRNDRLVQYYKNFDFDVASGCSRGDLRTCYMDTKTVEDAYSRLGSSYRVA